MTTFTKSLLAGIVVAMALLLLVMFIPYPPAREEARAYFSEQDIDTGLEFSFERRWFFVAATIVNLTLLCGLALTRIGRKLADFFLAWSGNWRIVAVLGMGLTYWIPLEYLSLPISIGRFAQAKDWDMSNLTFFDWLHRHFLAFGINLAAEAFLLAGTYLLMIWFPRLWWFLAAIGGGLLGVGYAFFAPLLINPLFNEFTPLEETSWRNLQPRVQAIITKAGLPAQEILVMDGSRQSNHSNAFFTGFGASRRIVLYDTLLKNHSAEEIESVLAHELGHWKQDHIVKGLLLGTLAALLGLFLLDRLLRLAIGREPWRLQSIADPAGVPLLFLLMYLGDWGVMPLANAVSRHFERQADEASLEIAGQPRAFIASEIKLARDNKSNVAPAPWNVWLFASHPPTVERIHMAEAWEKTQRP